MRLRRPGGVGGCVWSAVVHDGRQTFTRLSPLALSGFYVRIWAGGNNGLWDTIWTVIADVDTRRCLGEMRRQGGP